MRFALYAVAAVAIVIPSVARAAICSVGEATGRIEVADLELEARVATSDNKIMLQEKALLDSLPQRGDIPVGKLMNASQAELFGRLNAQHMAFYLEDLIESGLARDAEAVDTMFEAAHAASTDRPAPTASNKAPLQLYAFLRFVAQPKVTAEVPAVRPTGCSVDDALAAGIYDAEARLKAFPIALLQASQQTTDAIKVRYGSLDAPNMSPADREAVAMARNAVQPAFNDSNLENDLQNIRDWWSIAEQVHDDRLADIRENGADPKVIGTTEEVDFPRKTPRQQMLFRSWDALNAKMPSRHETQMEASAKLIDDLNKTHESASSTAGAASHQ